MSATTIRDAMDSIYHLEGTLAVTSPRAARVQKVWSYSPPADKVVTSTPCITNAHSPQAVSYLSVLSRVTYTVNINLLVKDTDSDRAADLASAFIQPVIDTFGANIKLGISEWTVLGLRFNGFQPLYFADYSAAAGVAVLGLDFFLDLAHNAGIVIAPGAPFP